MSGITTSTGEVNLSTSRPGWREQGDCGLGATVRLVAWVRSRRTTTPGTITASLLSVNDTTGNVVLELANAVGTVAVSLTNAGQAFSFNDDAWALIVGSVAAAAQGPAGPDPSGLFTPAVSGITTSTGEVNLSTSSTLALSSAIAASGATVRLVAGGAISQDATNGAITASMLSVKDTGGQVVLEASNAVGTVAASLTNPTSAFSFNDTVALIEGSVAAAAQGPAGPDPSGLFTPAVSGITTSTGEVNLSTSSTLALSNAIAASGATVRLVAGGAISQDATTGAITASMLSVKDTGGQVVLEASNAVGTVAASLTNPARRSASTTRRVD